METLNERADTHKSIKGELFSHEIESIIITTQYNNTIITKIIFFDSLSNHLLNSRCSSPPSSLLLPLSSPLARLASASPAPTSTLVPLANAALSLAVAGLVMIAPLPVPAATSASSTAAAARTAPTRTASRLLSHTTVNSCASSSRSLKDYSSFATGAIDNGMLGYGYDMLLLVSKIFASEFAQR